MEIQLSKLFLTKTTNQERWFFYQSFQYQGLAFMKTLKFLAGTTVALLFGAAFIPPVLAQTTDSQIFTTPSTGGNGGTQNNSQPQNTQQPSTGGSSQMEQPSQTNQQPLTDDTTTGESSTTQQNQTTQQQRTGVTDSTQIRRQTQTTEQQRTVETQPTQVQTGQDDVSPTPSTSVQEEQPVRGLW